MLLGMRLCEHDTNFALWDGERVRYHKTERSARKKHHAQDNLWEWKTTVREVFGVDPDALDEIAIVVDPWRHKLPMDREQFFPEQPFEYLPSNVPTVRVNHHWAHALSTWPISQLPRVNIVFDGFGDYDVAWTVFVDGEIAEQGSVEQDGSIGHLMYWMGTHLGVEADHREDIAGKTMGLIGHGTVDTQYLEYLQRFGIRDLHSMFDLRSWNKHCDSEVLGGLTAIDWAATCHERVGQALLELFRKYASPSDTVTYSGGVALNVVWNTLLKQEFPGLVIPPHCADEGLSLGALEYLRRKHGLAEFPSWTQFPYVQTDTAPDSVVSSATITRAALALAEGKTVGWYQGHGEIGPRALGNRSILMRADREDGRAHINSIKQREGYRPFGASVLAEHATGVFEDLADNPHMLYVGTAPQGLGAITHADGTSRAQTVLPGTAFHLLLSVFHDITGVPVLLNTSLNLAGEPIAGTPEQALELYHTSDLDVMVIGDEYYEAT